MDDLLDKLHDAVLLKIEHDWQSRTCKLCFRGSPIIDEPFVLEFQSVGRVEFSSSFPWGPSDSVLEAVTRRRESVTITMQSGDTVLVHSPNYSLKRTNQSLRD